MYILQIFRRSHQRRQELLQPADVSEFFEGRCQHAVPGVCDLSLLRVHFTNRDVRRTHGTEDRRTHGQ